VQALWRDKLKIGEITHGFLTVAGAIGDNDGNILTV
jgi:hypothetical protein